MGEEHRGDHRGDVREVAAAGAGGQRERCHQQDRQHRGNQQFRQPGELPPVLDIEYQ
ncbi:hypothetical protein [Amycolatopsis sp. NPDC051128]|uniref:hypothetical protein n=1 Tax=Amycolatopsis sp. NPDC051128 TaxID=3155412 RepID=UPI003438F085